MALEKAGDLDGAIDAAHRLIALEPDEALGHTSLSRFYQQKGMIPEAEDEKAIATKLAMRKGG
jgi:Flp pilus assembly protein TadD